VIRGHVFAADRIHADDTTVPIFEMLLPWIQFDQGPPRSALSDASGPCS
jgi:hypothetical protein